MRIALTKGLFATVDRRDFKRLSSFKWTAHFNMSTRKYSAVRFVRCVRDVTAKSGWKNISISMHQEIMGQRPGFEIDHKDRDSLKNRRSNLRWATRRQNAQNRMRYNKTGYKGVYKKRNRFAARITVAAARLYLGTFASPKAAAIAYNEAALTHFGEFARLNPV